jgi:chromosome partitioning related protein ParA
MQVISIISTKGGVGKTTTAANLGGLVADAGLRVLLLDLDVQPTLSSYYELAHRAPGGIYELLAFNERDLGQLVSRTIIAGLDLVLSNDHRGELNTLLLHAPDGRLRLRHLLPVLAPLYDLVLIDTQGARSVLLEMAVLASDLALSPVTPEILAARELRRGTMQLLEDIAPIPAPRHRAAAVASADQPRPPGVRQREADPAGPARPVPGPRRHPRARHRRAGHRSLSTRMRRSGLPVHRVEYRQPLGRVAPAALDTMRALAGELFPQWQERLARCPAARSAPLRWGGPMANAHELARGHKRLRALIEFAIGEGWHVKRTPAGTSSSPKPAALRSTPARPRATTGRPSMPARRSAVPSARLAWPRPPARRDAAMAEMTSQDMAGKLLAAGFERSGPSATTLSDPIADTPMVVTLDQLRPYDHDPRKKRNPGLRGDQGIHPRAGPGCGAGHHPPTRRRSLHHPQRRQHAPGDPA